MPKFAITAPNPDEELFIIEAPNLHYAQAFMTDIGMIEYDDGDYKRPKLWPIETAADDAVADVILGADGKPTEPIVTVRGGCADRYCGNVNIIDFDNLDPS